MTKSGPASRQFGSIPAQWVPTDRATSTTFQTVYRAELQPWQPDFGTGCDKCDGAAEIENF